MADVELGTEYRVTAERKRNRWWIFPQRTPLAVVGLDNPFLLKQGEVRLMFKRVDQESLSIVVLGQSVIIDFKPDPLTRLRKYKEVVTASDRPVITRRHEILITPEKNSSLRWRVTAPALTPRRINWAEVETLSMQERLLDSIRF